jgi:hypothetical protein
MPHVFPSDEWIGAFHEAMSESAPYRQSAGGWIHGAVVLVCKANPGIGLANDHGIWLDLHQGARREARACSAEEAEKHPSASAASTLGGSRGCARSLIPSRG